MKVVINVSDRVLRRLPTHILVKLVRWATTVEEIGLQRVRQIPGYHDEPLAGSRSGQRSIRLNRSYRAIYIEAADRATVVVIEVNKHEY